MTNEEIVLRESIALMKQGVLACAGQIDTINEETGEHGKIDMPEAIHTYQEWKELGYQVKKGEHAIAKFAVWKPVKDKKKEDQKEEQQVKSHFIMCNASWFKSSQVERCKSVGQ